MRQRSGADQRIDEKLFSRLRADESGRGDEEQRESNRACLATGCLIVLGRSFVMRRTVAGCRRGVLHVRTATRLQSRRPHRFGLSRNKERKNCAEHDRYD
jgi:hypothetical protein